MNPYNCIICNNDGFDHAPECPLHPDNRPKPPDDVDVDERYL